LFLYRLRNAASTASCSMSFAVAQHITLTDRYGHALMVCELPKGIRRDEVARLHHQILANFHGELIKQAPTKPIHLSWPEVVNRLEQRMDCLARPKAA